MIIAAVDTNVLVRGVIASHPTSASKGVVDALFDGRFFLLLSPEVVAEIQGHGGTQGGCTRCHDAHGSDKRFLLK